jgi:hypothetical protein
MKSANQDIRWQQFLSNYSLALQRITDALQLSQQRGLPPAAYARSLTQKLVKFNSDSKAHRY